MTRELLGLLIIGITLVWITIAPHIAVNIPDFAKFHGPLILMAVGLAFSFVGYMRRPK